MRLFGTWADCIPIGRKTIRKNIVRETSRLCKIISQHMNKFSEIHHSSQRELPCPSHKPMHHSDELAEECWGRELTFKAKVVPDNTPE